MKFICWLKRLKCTVESSNMQLYIHCTLLTTLNLIDDSETLKTPEPCHHTVYTVEIDR